MSKNKNAQKKKKMRQHKRKNSKDEKDKKKAGRNKKKAHKNSLAGKKVKKTKEGKKKIQPGNKIPKIKRGKTNKQKNKQRKNKVNIKVVRKTVKIRKACLATSCVDNAIKSMNMLKLKVANFNKQNARIADNKKQAGGSCILYGQSSYERRLLPQRGQHQNLTKQFHLVTHFSNNLFVCLTQLENQIWLF